MYATIDDKIENKSLLDKTLKGIMYLTIATLTQGTVGNTYAQQDQRYFATGKNGETVIIIPRGANAYDTQGNLVGIIQGNQVAPLEGTKFHNNLQPGNAIIRETTNPQNTFPQTEVPTQPSYSPKPPTNQPRPQYNFTNIKKYKDEVEKAWSIKDYQSLIFIAEEGLDKVKQQKIKGTKEDLDFLSHGKILGQDYMSITNQLRSR